MNWRAADLHVHSALSPCASNDMTPRRIVSEAVRLGLEIIAICDHNSAGNVRAVRAAAPRGLLVVAGMEIMTREEAHVTALFPKAELAEATAEIVQVSLPFLTAGSKIFGEQCIMDSQDNVVGHEQRMLSGAASLSLDDTVALIHTHGGLAVAAHVDRPSFSVVSQLGFLPEPNKFNAIEISPAGLRQGKDEKFRKCGLPIVVSSDSHYLSDMGQGFTGLQMGELSYEALVAALTGPAEGRRPYA